MDAPKCKICGVAHWSNQPHVGLTKGQALVVAKKSTAVRKDVPAAPQRVERAHPVQQEGLKSRGAVKALAGTQAPPVDTDSPAKASKAKPAAGKAKARKGDASRPSRGGGSPERKATGRKLSVSTPAATGMEPEDSASGVKPPSLPKSKRGRPSTGFDKKAYQRDLMSDRRAKAKEAKT